MHIRQAPAPTIRAIGTALPPHRLTQDQAAAYLGAGAGLTEAQTQRLQRVFAQTGIDTRHSVLAEFVDPSLATTGIGHADTSLRSDLYREHAPALALQASRDALAKAKIVATSVTHVITVSCTGMYAPGLEQDLAEGLGVTADAERTACNFLGCYAAFHALKQADYILRADTAAVVLVCCVELSSLHVHASISGDHLAGNALFADGAAAAVLTNVPSPNPLPGGEEGKPSPPGRGLGEGGEGTGHGLRLHRFLSRVAPDSRRDMAWTIGNHGFDIRLSSYVPGLLEKGIGQLAQDLYAKAGLAAGQRPQHYAIHPGGVRILQACEAALGLTENDLAHSYRILRDCGNMSSVTVLFVLDELLQQGHPTPGDHVLACAFGPGLTMESLLAEVV